MRNRESLALRRWSRYLVAFRKDGDSCGGDGSGQVKGRTCSSAMPDGPSLTVSQRISEHGLALSSSVE